LQLGAVDTYGGVLDFIPSILRWAMSMQMRSMLPQFQWCMDTELEFLLQVRPTLPLPLPLPLPYSLSPLSSAARIPPSSPSRSTKCLSVLISLFADKNNNTGCRFLCWRSKCCHW
jgi:hypothetical protein